jgi:hypothetical protein
MEQKNKKVSYLIAYHYPRGSKEVSFLELNTDDYEKAVRLAKCVFGETGVKNLYQRKLDI